MKMHNTFQEQLLSTEILFLQNISAAVVLILDDIVYVDSYIMI